MEIMTIIISTINIYFLSRKIWGTYSYYFLIWFPYWKGCAFYNCSSFYTPNHCLPSQFFKVFLEDFSFVQLCTSIYLYDDNEDFILPGIYYVSPLLGQVYCFYPVHPYMQFLLYFKLEFLKNLQYLTNDSDFWSMVITLSMAFYVLFLLNGKYMKLNAFQIIRILFLRTFSKIELYVLMKYSVCIRSYLWDKYILYFSLILITDWLSV